MSPSKKKIIKRYKKARGAGCPGRPPPVWSVGARLLPQLGRFLEVSKKCVLATFLPPAGKSMCPRSQPPRNLRFVGPAGLEGSCGHVSAGCLQAALRGCPPAGHRGAQLGGEEVGIQKHKGFEGRKVGQRLRVGSCQLLRPVCGSSSVSWSP